MSHTFPPPACCRGRDANAASNIAHITLCLVENGAAAEEEPRDGAGHRPAASIPVLREPVPVPIGGSAARARSAQAGSIHFKAKVGTVRPRPDT